MKSNIHILVLIGALFLLNSCHHRIVRTGYNKVNYDDAELCDIPIRKMDSIDVNALINLGKIKLGESGFSTACSEEHAIDILRKEACGLKADFIHITYENRPDLWSSCYRCEADFYQFKDASLRLSQDQAFTKSQVQSRVKNDRAQNTAVLIGAFAVGFIIGFMIILY